MKNPAEVARGYLTLGKIKTEQTAVRLLLLGMLAGAFIALAGAAATFGNVYVGKVAGAAIFPAGLTMVVLAGSELFTGNCLLIIPLLEREIRLRALLRRANIEASRKLTVGGLVLDADGLTAALDGVEIPVTTREFNILYKLLSYPNHAFSRSQLMDEFWGIESGTGLRAVDVYITKLRDKFSACPAFEIKTVRGLGYKAVLK